MGLGEIFRTKHPNHIAFQMNDKLAPGSYSYLIIIDGVGLICTCLWRNREELIDSSTKPLLGIRTLPRYRHGANKRVGGKGILQ